MFHGQNPNFGSFFMIKQLNIMIMLKPISFIFKSREIHWTLHFPCWNPPFKEPQGDNFPRRPRPASPGLHHSGLEFAELLKLAAKGDHRAHGVETLLVENCWGFSWGILLVFGGKLVRFFFLGGIHQQDLVNHNYSEIWWLWWLKCLYKKFENRESYWEISNSDMNSNLGHVNRTMGSIEHLGSITWWYDYEILWVWYSYIWWLTCLFHGESTKNNWEIWE